MKYDNVMTLKNIAMDYWISLIYITHEMRLSPQKCLSPYLYCLITKSYSGQLGIINEIRQN